MKKSVLSKDGLVQLWDAISNLFVRKETGKGLSMNDFTNSYKVKLDGIADNAQRNVIESILIDEEALEITDKAVILETLTDEDIDAICTDEVTDTENNGESTTEEETGTDEGSGTEEE